MKECIDPDIQGVAFILVCFSASKYKDKIVEIIKSYQVYTVKPDGWHCHHIRPRSEGGNDSRENILYIPQWIHLQLHRNMAYAHKADGDITYFKTNMAAADLLYDNS